MASRPDEPFAIKLREEPNVAYEVIRMFGEDRALCRYNGLAVFFDHGPEGWSLGGPARDDDERAAVEAAMPAKDTTEVDVVADDSRGTD